MRPSSTLVRQEEPPTAKPVIFEAYKADDVERAMREIIDALERTGSCMECGRRAARGHASGCGIALAIDTARRFL